MLNAHGVGIFETSAYFVEHSKRSSDVAGALVQRFAGVMGLPFELCPANKSTNAAGLKTRIEARWPHVFPRETQRKMLEDRVMLGFTVARLTGAYDPTHDEIVPSVERWHPALVQRNQSSGTWEAFTGESWVTVLDEFGRVAEGWIVSLAGERLTAQFEGAINALAECFLGSQYAARDARRHSERMGQGILEAKVPGDQAETDEAKDFVKALSRVGSTGLIVAPQYLDKSTEGDAAPSYGLEMHFPPAEGMSGLLALDGHETQKIRLRILGQDTTSKDSTGGGHARSQTGAGIRQDLVEDDAIALKGIASQLFDGWALLENRPRELFPVACWDATPPEDSERKSRERQANSQAISSLVSSLEGLKAMALEAGTKIDHKALLEMFGVPLLENTDHADA